MIVNFKKLVSNAQTPTYTNSGDAGADLFAVADILLPAHSMEVVATGITVEIPTGYLGYLVPQLNLAKLGIEISNSPGIINSGYNEEILVVLVNTSATDNQINAGDKVAQLVIQQFEAVDFQEVTA